MLVDASEKAGFGAAVMGCHGLPAVDASYIIRQCRG
jgi:hypothetical protein